MNVNKNGVRLCPRVGIEVSEMHCHALQVAVRVVQRDTGDDERRRRKIRDPAPNLEPHDGCRSVHAVIGIARGRQIEARGDEVDCVLTKRGAIRNT